MDSLTQIVLGASVGEAVLGKKVGNKAMLWGAIAGTIPDLDVFARYFVDPWTAQFFHRGFSHSIFFSLLVAPALAYGISRLYKNKEATFRQWTLFFFLTLVTHPLLDMLTTWGTQLFWPFEYRIAIQSVFVLDPFYTIPFLGFLIATLFYKRTHKKRRRLNRLGLIISCTYLLLGLIVKGFVHFKVETELSQQKVAYHEIDTRPTPLNIILWNITVKTDSTFLIGYYSLLDNPNTSIDFSSYKINSSIIEPYKHLPPLSTVLVHTQGWYNVEKKGNEIFVNDLRFGEVEFGNTKQGFRFSYKVIPENKKLNLERVSNMGLSLSESFSKLIDRILGL